MSNYQFTDGHGTFTLADPQHHSYLYFPLTDENGVMSSITPELGGDSKTGENSFLLEPVSSDNLHGNKSSRNFWILTEGERPWSATGVSAWQQGLKFTGEEEKVSLTAGLLYQTVTRTSRSLQLTCEITSFVPHTKLRTELTKVTIRNDADKARVIRCIAAVPIYGRSAANIRDHRNVTSMLNRIYTLEAGVVNMPTMAFDERGHLVNELSYGVFGKLDGQFPEGFIPTLETFIGEGGSLEAPRTMVTGELPLTHSGREIDGYECMGTLVFPKLELAPGESVSSVIALVYDEKDPKGTEEKILPLLTAEKFDELLAASKEHWADINHMKYRSGDTSFDNWMYWVDFQPTLRRIFGCSFLPHHDYGKGGRGWRDLWQDCLALLIMNPDGVRDMLVANFGGVRADGTNATIIGAGLGEFVADRNGIARVWMDHGMWPWLTVQLYLNQTGDYGLLREKAPYFKDRMILHGDGADEEWEASQGSLQRDESGEVVHGTVLEHLLIEHLTSFYDVGEHNHIRIRGADWNDALDMAADRGESVAFTAMYAKNLLDLADTIELCQKKCGLEKVTLMKELEILIGQKPSVYDSIDQKKQILSKYLAACAHTVSGRHKMFRASELAEDLRAKGEWIREHIRRTEWVRESGQTGWYNGYYDNDANALEGIGSDGSANIMLTSQVFAILSGTASDEQVAQIVSAADKYLYRAEVGGYRLNTNFHEIKHNMGRMFGFAYGQKENGSVFCHMATMFANSLYRRGFAEAGYKVIRAMYDHVRDIDRAGIYPGIPEYIDGNGRGVYHYLTGAGSWLAMTVLCEMFGIKGDQGDLVLQPKLMREQLDENGRASAEFVFAGRKLCVTYQMDAGRTVQSGPQWKVLELSIDGAAHPAGRIPRSVIEALSEDDRHEIIAIL